MSKSISAESVSVPGDPEYVSEFFYIFDGLAVWGDETPICGATPIAFPARAGAEQFKAKIEKEYPEKVLKIVRFVRVEERDVN